MTGEPLHDIHELDKRRHRSYGVGMIEQVAKLGSDAEYIKRDVGELRTDMREIKLEFRELRDRQERDFRILFGAIIATAVGITSILARGFGWI